MVRDLTRVGVAALLVLLPAALTACADDSSGMGTAIGLVNAG